MPVNPDIIFILLYFQKKVYRQSECKQIHTRCICLHCRPDKLIWEFFALMSLRAAAIDGGYGTEKLVRQWC